MKILHVIPYYKPAYVYGGPIESVSKLCESLVTAGHSVDVYTSTANGVKELDVVVNGRTNINGVNVWYFKRITKDPTNASPALWQQLNGTVLDYDIVHIHTWWNFLALVSCFIAQKSGAKVIVSPRGMLTNYIFNSGSSFLKKLIHRTIGKKLLKQSYFHATSSSEYQECTALINNWKGFTAPNILSLPPLPVSKVTNGTFTMIYMSRIHPKKGLEVLFEALSELEIDFKLKIAGSGEEDYLKKLKDLAKRLKISEKIDWLGWKQRDEKYRELNNADMFVLVSKNENFANVVIESLYMGTPVLISEDVALSEFVRDKDLGWVTSLFSKDIKENIIAAYTSINKRREIEKKARQLIEDSFSENKVIAEYISNYNKVLTNIEASNK